MLMQKRQSSQEVEARISLVGAQHIPRMMPLHDDYPPASLLVYSLTVFPVLVHV
jgi:hypothetical protein